MPKQDSTCHAKAPKKESSRKKYPFQTQPLQKREIFSVSRSMMYV